MVAGAESAQPVDRSLFTDLHALIAAGDRRFQLLSTVHDAAEPLAQLEAMTHTSMWNMQRHASLSGLSDGEGLTERSRRRGVELRYILPRRVAEQRCPLASSHWPHLRLAPVPHPLMVVDGTRVLVGDSTGETLWTTSDPSLVARAARYYDRVWQAAPPAVPEGEEPPFTPRMVQVGIRLVDGSTDREIARALGVSERTVSSDVREMSQRLGERSRTHAIALIAGING
ncbi:MAG TPA: LuxR C-terminal-related transcriptional regulator [Ornithinibacter sp.]|nr:LuxR C-terminal-related transcriptional regulator [Ornithinibacter sp.]